MKKAKKVANEYKKFKDDKKSHATPVYDRSSTAYDDSWLKSAPGTGTDTIIKGIENSEGKTTFVPLNMATMPSYKGDDHVAAFYSENNCAPTAITTIMKYWYEKRGITKIYKNKDRDDTYNRLCTLVKYDPSTGTNSSNYSSAIKNYAKEQGCTATFDSYWLDSWSDFTRDIKANKTILVSIGGNSNGKKVGHACVAFGYRINSDGSKYLRIADGWSVTTKRYVKFKVSGLNYFNGYAVTIK